MTKALKIPKSLGISWRTLADPFIFPMVLKTIDVDRIMIRFMELTMRKGYLTRPLKRATENDYVNLFLQELSVDLRISGLTEEERREVLDGWIRATLIELERSGKARDKGKYIAYVKPVTLGVIRAGLPRNNNMVLHADLWAYRLCLDELELRGVTNVRAQMRETIHHSLGEGINLSRDLFQSSEPVYDESTDIDITALLAMRLLSKFTDARPGENAEPNGKTESLREIWPTSPWEDNVRKDSRQPSGLTPREPAGLSLLADRPSKIENLVATPNAFLPVGRDLVDILSNYGSALSHTELTQHCIALLSFRLFQAPLRVGVDLKRMVAQRDGDQNSEPNSRERNPLQMYCDFTNGAVRGSLDLAKLCVRRDIEIHHELLRSRLEIRALTWIGELLNQETRNELAAARNESVNFYFQKLLRLRNTQEFEQAGLLKIRQFKESLQTADDDTSAGWTQIIEEWESEGLSSYEILTQILRTAYTPGSRAPAEQFQWFWTTGGLLNRPPHRPYALLAGTVGAKSTWRYAPSDSLLMSMLIACFVDGEGEHQWVDTELRLTDLLRRMEDRFGILVDQPPTEFANADNQKVATQNKQAFVRKLKLFGCFEGLSDDPEYQLVTCPRESNNVN